MEPAVAPGSIGVVDPEGNVTLAPASDFSVLRAEGYSLATPDQLAILQEREKQAGLLGALKTAAESAAATGTFGASTWAETTLGITTPEAITARAEEHPVSNFVGAGLGALVPLAGEEAVAARLGEGLASRVIGGAPGAISRLGEGATAAVRAGITPTSKLGRISTEVLARGAGSAIEGAAYGLGQSVSEDALDPDLTVESAFARGAADALLGAGLGAAIGAPLGLVSSVLKTGKSTAELADMLEDISASRDLKSTGGNTGKLIERGGKLGRDKALQLAKEGRELGLFSWFSSPESIFDKASELLDTVGDRMRSFIGRADDAALTDPKATADIKGVLDAVRKGPLAELKKSAFQESATNQLGRYVEILQAESGAAAVPGRSSIDGLWSLRKDIDQKLYGFKGDQSADGTVLKDALKSFRGIVSDEIGAAVGRSGLDSAEWKSLSRDYAVGSEIQKLAGQGVKSAANRGGTLSLTETGAVIAGALHGGPLGVVAPAGYIAAHRYGGDIAGMAARAGARVLRGNGAPLANAAKSVEKAAAVAVVDTAVEHAEQSREKIAALAALERSAREVVQDTNAAMAGLVTKARPPKVAPAPNSAEILKTVQGINELVNRPERTMDLVARLGDETNAHAPGMTIKSGEVSGRLISYLAQNAPQVSRPFPLGPEIMPDRGTLLVFHKKVQALKDPIGTLADNPSKVAVGAIEAVYPTLLQNARVALLSALAEAGDKTFTQRQRATFSTILGTDLDGSNSPQMSALSQAAFLASSAPTMHHARQPSAKAKTPGERYEPGRGGSLRNP